MKIQIPLFRLLQRAQVPRNTDARTGLLEKGDSKD